MAETQIDASIWLRLDLAEEAKVTALIQRLARRHGTHAFLPHLTVCGPCLDPTSLPAASAYARTSPVLPLRVSVEAISSAVGNPFEAVVIRVVNSPQLSTFREELRRITGAGEGRPPHVSLFYGVGQRHTVMTFGAASLDEIARECRLEADAGEYLLERPAIAYPGDGGSWLRVSEWRVNDL